MPVSNSENYFNSERYHNNCNMKSITAILVALTVFTLFLESSTAPSNVISNVLDAITEIGTTVNIKDGDKQAMYELMESTEAAIPRAKKIAADAIPDATGTEKLTLVAVHTWLVGLEPAVLLIHDEIRAAIASGSVIDIEAVLVQIYAAVATAKVTLNGFKKALSPGEVNDGINKNVNKGINNAICCSDILKTYL